MAGLSTNFSYTYDGKLTTEIFMKPSGKTPAMSDIFTIRPGINYKEQLSTLNPISKILKNASADCSRTFTDGPSFGNQTLTVEEFEINEKFCKKDFEGSVGNILAEEWLKQGIDSFNIEGTQIAKIISDYLNDAARRDTHRRVMFDDSGDVDDNWNQIDGLWTKLIAGTSETGVDNPYCIQRTTTELGTTALGTDDALGALEEAYEESAILLKEIPESDKYFYVTGSMWENLLKSYENKSNGTENQFSRLLQGPGGTMTYRGVKIIGDYALDRHLADTTNPLYGTTEHMVLYSTKMNHVLGVAKESDMQRIEGWYDRDSREYKFEGNMKFGYQYVHCDLSTIAY